MTLFAPSAGLSLDQPCVALDLETTGLDPQRDEIIEVGAVRFQGHQVLGTFQTLVNPYRPLPAVVQRLTGISGRDLEGAPPFATVAGELLAFVADAPLVGHSVSFDLGFLAQRGLHFTAPVFDTRDLAFLLFPKDPGSLADLAAALGVSHPRPHRAYPDASATHQVFVALAEKLHALDPGVQQELHRIATTAGWPLRYLLRPLMEAQQPAGGGVTSQVGPGGLDFAALERRTGKERPSAIRRHLEAIPPEALKEVVRPGGALARALLGYEHRREQEAMLSAVDRALNQEEHLLVEAGTGVGKTIAYLLPAAVFAATKQKRVVIATNTINLQEQLIQKDIPVALKALEDAEGLHLGGVKAALLKGRANYLCLRRWTHLRSRDALSLEEARLLSKTLVWLQTTSAGDLEELSLRPPDLPVWAHLSASGAQGCPYNRGPCFLRAAREKAEAAHLVVVNHALLLSDLAAGGGFIPSYEYLIVDEAHHLEEEATRQFGFQLSQTQLDEHLDRLVGPRGFASEAVASYRGASVARTRLEATQGAAASLAERAGNAREHLGQLFGLLARFLLQAQDRAATEIGAQLRVTPGLRSQESWARLELAGEKADAALKEVGEAIGELWLSLEGLESAGVVNYEGIRMELTASEELNGEYRSKLRQFLAKPEPETIYWMEQQGTRPLALCSAPLHVGKLLEEKLFSQKRSVVLTSATLRSQGSFDYIRGRLGLEEPQELALDSPFPYHTAALLCLPTDVPEPTSAGYASALAGALVELTRAAGGRTMALFTSHSALRAAHEAVRAPLAAAGLRVLGQGIEGSPRRLLEQFLEDPRGILLGTSSFWEGVDLAGDALQVVVIARLPFSVPTEPVFAARAQLFEDPFGQYTVPQAVLRFRQGFGRLIRSQRDRGAVVVLDSRVRSRSYGAAFLASIPPCTVVHPTLSELPHRVARWLGRGYAAPH